MSMADLKLLGNAENRTDVAWWQEHCMSREIHYIRGRLKFGNAKHNAPFGCAVVVFRPSLSDVEWVA